MKKMWKKEIDERQQQELNRVHATAYWLAFYLLIIAVLVESFFMNRPFREWAVEWGIFMVLALYEIFQSMRIGVWSEYKQNPTVKDYLRYSVIGSFLFAVIFTVGNWRQAAPEQRAIGAYAVLFAEYFGFLFVLMFGAFLACGVLLKRRRRKQEELLNKELAEEDDDELE